MKRGIVFLSFCLVSGFMLMSCQRDNSVHAGNDNDTYLPRPAVKRNLANIANEAVVGELVRVDSQKKTFVVRVDNGMEQTFKFDASTTVAGLAERTDCGSDASKARQHEQPRHTESDW